MKKILIFFMAAVLAFTVPAEVVFASDGTESGSASWVDAIRNNVAYVDYVNGFIRYDNSVIDFRTLINMYNLSPVIAVYDSTVGTVGAGMRYFIKLVKQGRSPSEARSYMASLVNTENGSSSVTGDGLEFVTDYYSDGSLNGTGNSLSNLGYVYNYIPSQEYINPNGFSDARFYWALRNLIKNNPDYLFALEGDYYGNGSYAFSVTKVPVYAGVKPRYDWGKASDCTLYNENWNTNFGNPEGDWVSMYLSMPTRNVDQVIINYVEERNQNTGAVTWAVAYEGSQNVTLDLDSINNPDVPQYYYGNSTFPYVGLTYPSVGMIIKGYSNDTLATPFFAANNLQFPVFASLADLKKGTVGKSSSTLLPSYTGNGINNSPISDSVIQQAEDIINNYYNDVDAPSGGNGDNNNDNNNDDDSGSGIWDTISCALRGVLQVLGELIAGLLDGIANILPTIANLFTGLKDLANTGFVQMLSAFFPFLPTEWFSVIGLGIGLVLLIFIVRVFKG